ncbi:MAG: DUF1810 domain-containing protein [Alphaproteobacteria bacterium]|nr:DUF1810 domain-containing protein [Alphaproteobacteria bacterium]
MDDRFNLQRFLTAQDPVFETVRSELREGRKRTHWMWFIFPQINGLGRSPTSKYFAISSKEEAQAYLGHPILGPRLRESTRLVERIEGCTIGEIFGSPDDLKFKSSMTLFAAATPDNRIFVDALRKYFAGEKDEATLSRLK